MMRHIFAVPLLAALTATAFVAPAQAGAGAGGEGLIKMKSQYSVDKTLDRLASALESKGLTVFARIDHGANAKGADLELRPTQVLIFGNPNLGTPLMQARQTMGIDLPQKALAYQDTEGEVWLAYNDPAYLAERHGITSEAGIRAKIAKALKAFAQKATQ